MSSLGFPGDIPLEMPGTGSQGFARGGFLGGFPRQGEDLEDLGILGYLYYVCSYLGSTDWEEIEAENVMENLESLADDLEGLESCYLNPAPPGGKSIREVMLEIVSHLLNAMEELASYMEDNLESHLEEGVSLLNLSSEMVEALLGTVSQERLELAEFMSQLDKEGIPGREKANREKLIRINLTDADSPITEELSDDLPDKDDYY